MVSTVSAASHTSGMEKKRKHTLERAQANHLSRQLQMRLQYARLKVEHGWQRQNLNEVENLYFHYAHQRGANSYISSTLTPDQRSFAATTRNIDSPFKSLFRFQSECLTLDTSSKNSSTAKLALGPAAAVMPQTTLTPFCAPNSPTGFLETRVVQQSQDYITSAQTLITDSQVVSSVQSIGSDINHLPAAESLPASKEPQHSRPSVSTPTTLSKMYPVPHINEPTSTSLTYDSFWSESAVNETSGVTEHSQAAISSFNSVSSALSSAPPRLNLTSPFTPSLLPISAQPQPSSLSTTLSSLSSVSAPMPLA